MQRTKQHCRAFQSIFVFVIFLLSPWVGIAETPNWYQVNVIIFTRLAKTYYESEKWRQPPPLPNTPTWQTLSKLQNDNQDSVPSIKAFEPLPADQFQLNKEKTRLKNSRNYHIIFASSWVQPITDQKTKPVFFKGDQNFDIPVKLDDENAKDSAAQITPQIQGLLSFKQTNYIQINANLRLTESMEDLPSQGFSLFSTDNSQYQTFALNQTQRSRPNEIHYFDHPLFGMIIKLTPYTPSPDLLRNSDPTVDGTVALNTLNHYIIRP